MHSIQMEQRTAANSADEDSLALPLLVAIPPEQSELVVHITRNILPRQSVRQSRLPIKQRSPRERLRWLVESLACRLLIFGLILADFGLLLYEVLTTGENDVVELLTWCIVTIYVFEAALR
jgi:hypothetical protein